MNNVLYLDCVLFVEGLPSFAPAVNFLQGAGQGHIVTQVSWEALPALLLQRVDN